MPAALTTERTRIPDGRLEKARFYLTMAQAELAKARLQSAESFLRLAAFMDPSNPSIGDLLEDVVAERDQRRIAART